MAVLSQAQPLIEKRALKEHTGITAWVTARQAFGIAIEALQSHKLRSFLTLLGVVIATTTLIVVMSIVNGMNVYIAEHIANLGTNTFVLHQFKWAQGFDAFLKARRRNQPIRIEDYEYLRDNLQGYQHIGAFSMLTPNPRARYQTHLIDEITLQGMTPSFIDLGREKVQRGRYMNDTDYQHNARVCVIGQDLVEKLFPMVRDPMRSVKFGGFGMRALRADRAKISTSPRSRSVAGNAFRLIASSETRAGQGRCRAFELHHLPSRTWWRFGISSPRTIPSRRTDSSICLKRSTNCSSTIRIWDRRDRI